MESGSQIATLAGGCFWCLEAVFVELRGVLKVESGFSGGTLVNPTYRQVCEQETGHAEVVQVTFDPKGITYTDLLNIFFAIHDPTTLNRQGGDTGTQYRSAIFYHSPEQNLIAQQTITDLDQNHIWGDHIVTQVVPFEKFYKAEDYHQNYFANNPNQPYCGIVVAPKVTKFRKQFIEKLKK
ncbi:MAG: peptide-methionine (S)-S-oxide reductase [Chloroflexi bacterium GWB2_49_20]|nr:MAG: peptide-methionine (S)-S-oxide reductase [Chloroflexi bacterium GWB2_49_20]OGN79401.1 MAG: peptide-methionine (S)-S-oxide reductase [Chloroflexi bacterium GWC2_49_37]OGN82829.1 MAG: peptide-methionine (S)-S-oxide reductase [Chloroflexi bacterium GWD2_49_16]HCC79732.1 peptide-methionine (S)-S-oxide reductase [Anaerolineae bacterium]HCM97304.1 peptide-methionine (S)-S-oxide reductase [Anaerolineae bacterium]